MVGTPSTQSEPGEHGQDDHHEADKVDNGVHWKNSFDAFEIVTQLRRGTLVA
jgi:hypothetical protein